MKTVIRIFLWLLRLLLFIILLATEYALALCLELVKTLKGAIRFK